MRLFRVAILAVILNYCSASGSHVTCKNVDFKPAPYDHIIEYLPTMMARHFTGRLKVRPQDITGGIWPAGMDARIELHSPRNDVEFIDVGADGSFTRPNLRPGPYCFKVSATGFRSMIGTVVIDQRAHDSAPFTVDLLISE